MSTQATSTVLAINTAFVQLLHWLLVN